MQSAPTFSVNFIVRKTKADKTKANIYARITVDGGIPKEISLKEEINHKDWNNNKEMVVGKNVQAKTINCHIEDVRSRIRAKYRELERTDQLITAETVRDAYLAIQAKLKGHTLRELTEYYKLIWEPKLKKGGFKNYKTTITYIEQFLDSKALGTDVYLSQLNGEFATDFEHFIRISPLKSHDPCKGNGVAKHIQRFKRILNWAADDLKWITFNQCEKYKCPIKKTKRKKLSFQELVSIEQRPFADHMIEYVRELFLFSSYTGLAFAEVMKLNENDFEYDLDGTVWCKVYRQKTDELCAVPLLKSAANILNKFRAERELKGRITIFRQITNQTVNELLKTIQEVCCIQTPLTFHVGRHTFAKTVALKNGITLETVQIMLGHSKISSTQIYADVDEEKVLTDMKGLDERLDEKRAIVKLSKAKNCDTSSNSLAL